MNTSDALVWSLVLSGAGHVIHNVAEFGIAAVVAFETLLPLALTGALIAIVGHRLSKGVLLIVGAWGLIVLVAGAGTVFPLSILPFVPDQSGSHYVIHGIYALLQVPLLAVVAMRLQYFDRPTGAPSG